MCSERHTGWASSSFLRSLSYEYLFIHNCNILPTPGIYVCMCIYIYVCIHRNTWTRYLCIKCIKIHMIPTVPTQGGWQLLSLFHHQAWFLLLAIEWWEEGNAVSTTWQHDRPPAINSHDDSLWCYCLTNAPSTCSVMAAATTEQDGTVMSSTPRAATNMRITLFHQIKHRAEQINNVKQKLWVWLGIPLLPLNNQQEKATMKNHCNSNGPSTGAEFQGKCTWKGSTCHSNCGNFRGTATWLKTNSDKIIRDTSSKSAAWIRSNSLKIRTKSASGIS